MPYCSESPKFVMASIGSPSSCTRWYSICRASYSMKNAASEAVARPSAQRPFQPTS